MLDQPDIRARIQASVERSVTDLPGYTLPMQRMEFRHTEGAIDFALLIGAISSDERADLIKKMSDAVPGVRMW